jgi:hypothetical protein
MIDARRASVREIGMWNILWVVLVVLAACAFAGYLRRSTPPRKPAEDTYVCSDCNEHHCSCRKEG